MEIAFPEFVQDVAEGEERMTLASQPSGWESVRFDLDDEPDALPP
jgi:hypothetical protein